MNAAQSSPWLYLYLAGDYQAGADSPYILRLSYSVIVYFRRILRALNQKIEYTARIAPAQLGKAHEPDTYDWMRGAGVAVAKHPVKATSMPGKIS